MFTRVGATVIAEAATISEGFAAVLVVANKGAVACVDTPVPGKIVNI